MHWWSSVGWHICDSVQLSHATVPSTAIHIMLQSYKGRKTSCYSPINASSSCNLMCCSFKPLKPQIKHLKVNLWQVWGMHGRPGRGHRDGAAGGQHGRDCQVALQRQRVSGRGLLQGGGRPSRHHQWNKVGEGGGAGRGVTTANSSWMFCSFSRPVVRSSLFVLSLVSVFLYVVISNILVIFVVASFL